MSRAFIFFLVLIALGYFALKWHPAAKKKSKNNKKVLQRGDPLALVSGQPLVLAALAALAVYNCPQNEDIDQEIAETILKPLASATAAKEASIVARSLYRSLNDPIKLIDSAGKHMVTMLKPKERAQFFTLLQENLQSFGTENSPYYLNRLRERLEL